MTTEISYAQIQGIERIGQIFYVDRIQAEDRNNRDVIRNNPAAGLDFMLHHFSYQGRTDEMSDQVYNEATSVIWEHLPNGWPKEKNFQVLMPQLARVVGSESNKVGKGQDYDMISGLLYLVAELPKGNPTEYVIQEIEKGRIADLYEFLQEVKGIGPKVAAFYLRDLVTVFGLESYIAREDQLCVQPIDVWVGFVSRLLNFHQFSDDEIQKRYWEVAECMVEAAYSHEVCPLRLNAGAWYAGYFPYECLFEVFTW